MINKVDELTDKELIEKIHKSIIDQFGINGYIRYIRLQHPNNEGQDYLKVQDEIFKNMTLEEIYEKVAKFHEDTHK